jgi:O-antigen/teichoic acid export membrane protein
VISLLIALRGLPRAPVVEPSVSWTDLRRFGLRSLLGSTSLIEVLSVDKAVVWWLLGPSAVGLYVVSTGFTTLPLFIGQSLGSIAYPRVAAARAAGGSGRAVGARFVTLALMVILPLCVLMVLGARPIVAVFAGDAFGGSVMPARILVFAALVISTRRVLAECARGAGYGGLDSIAEAALWLFYLPCAWLLASERGLSGVAVALTGGTIVGLAVLSGLLWLRGGRPAIHVAGIAATRDAPPSGG